MKKNIKKLSALVFALVLAIPMQIFCVFAEETNIEDKFQPLLWEYLQELEDENEKVPVTICLYLPDYTGLRERVLEEVGERLTPKEYVALYGEGDYYNYCLEYEKKYNKCVYRLQEEIHLQYNKDFIEENGLSYEDLIYGELVGDPFISIYLTKEEIFDIVKNDKVESVYYHDMSPDEPDIDYVEEVIIGDVNKDGKVTPMDAYLVQRYLVGYEEFTPQQKLYLADVTNSDVPKGASNAVTTVDVLEILRYTVGYASDSQVGQMDWISIDDDSNYNPGDIVVDSDLEVFLPE